MGILPVTLKRVVASVLMVHRSLNEKAKSWSFKSWRSNLPQRSVSKHFLSPWVCLSVWNSSARFGGQRDDLLLTRRIRVWCSKGSSWKKITQLIFCTLQSKGAGGTGAPTPWYEARDPPGPFRKCFGITSVFVSHNIVTTLTLSSVWETSISSSRIFWNYANFSCHSLGHKMIFVGQDQVWKPTPKTHASPACMWRFPQILSEA